MLSHKPNQKRRWINLLILVQLMTMLLPVHVVSAADQQIVIPKETVDAMVFQALWMQTFDFAADDESPSGGDFSTAERKDKLNATRRRINVLPTEGFLYDEFVIAGGEIPDFGDILAHLKKKYLEAMGADFDKRSKKSEEEIIFAMLDIAKTIPELQPHVKTVWKVLTNPKKTFNGTTGVERNNIFKAGRKYKMREIIRERGPKNMKAIFQSAQHIPEVAIAYDVIYGDEMGVSIKDFDAADYLARNPDSDVFKDIDDCCSVRDDGTISLSLNDIKQFSQAEFDKINDSITDLTNTLSEIDAKQDVIVDYINNQQERELMEAVAAAEAAEHQLKLNAIQSSLFIAYTLADVVDPEFAYQLSTVGNSTLQVAESLNSWMQTIAGLGKLGGAFSTIVMSGNVLGAVMNVVSLFGDSGPTIDQMILEEIGKLRRQVDKLRTEMHSRFDRIDEELNEIYVTMQDRFDLIDIQLGRLNGKVDEVQRTLIGLDNKLSRVERNNFEFINALGRRPLLEAINGGLGYQERTGVPMPFQPEFVNFENVLQSWGTIHAFDALNTGPTQREYTPDKVLMELNTFPLDSNINYLNGWLLANGIPGFTDKPLASPRDWLFATRAYNDLGMEWPAHMQRIDPLRQAQLETVGLDLEEAMVKISTVQTVSGTVGNTLLFSHVITNYQEHLDALEDVIEEFEVVYVKEVVDSLHPGQALDLYGGANQELTFVSPEMTTMTCGDGAVHGNFPATNNLKAMIPNFNLYNLAEYLTLGHFSACLSDEWSETFEHCDIDFEPPFERHCHMRGTWTGTLTVKFGDVVIMTESLTNADEPVAENFLKDRWTINGYKEAFELLPTADLPTPEEAAQRATHLNAVTAQVEERLAVYQKEMYRRVRDAITDGSLFTPAVRVAGGKALLDSYVTLGLPRAVEEDELLRSMLYGNQQLMEDSQIAQTYNISFTQPITGTSLLINPRTLIWQTAAERTAAFRTLINQYLDAITAQTHVEGPDSATNARRELAMTMSLLGVADAPATPEIPTTPETPETPTTPGTPTTPEPPDLPSADAKRIFLPSVER